MTPPEKTIRRESLFLRVLWMLLFFLVWQVAVPLLAILVVAQLLYRLFYRAPSLHFMNFGDSLSQYLGEIGRFAVFNTDAKPWPVADWPQARVANGEAAHVPKAKDAAAAPASAATASVTEAAVEVKQAVTELEEELAITEVHVTDAVEEAAPEDQADQVDQADQADLAENKKPTAAGEEHAAPAVAEGTAEAIQETKDAEDAEDAQAQADTAKDEPKP